MYYSDEPETHYCPQCDAHEQTEHNINYWLEAVIDQLYYVSKSDMSDLEAALQELCSLVHMKLPKGALNIQRKQRQSTIDRALVEWVKFNNQVLQNI